MFFICCMPLGPTHTGAETNFRSYFNDCSDFTSNVRHFIQLKHYSEIVKFHLKWKFYSNEIMSIDTNFKWNFVNWNKFQMKFLSIETNFKWKFCQLKQISNEILFKWTIIRLKQISNEQLFIWIKLISLTILQLIRRTNKELFCWVEMFSYAKLL